MKTNIIAVIGTLLLGCGACVTNKHTLEELASHDLKCAPEAVTITLESRPYVGVTRYTADGCNRHREYICDKTFWFSGIPVGNASCKRDRH
jgi:hypothetical protein